MQRFIGKKPHKKIVKPISNLRKQYKAVEVKPEIETKIENKEVIEESDMNNKINEINDVLSGDKAPKRKVKVEKKDKGLFERTENSTVLITEDNKMLLND